MLMQSYCLCSRSLLFDCRWDLHKNSNSAYFGNKLQDRLTFCVIELLGSCKSRDTINKVFRPYINHHSLKACTGIAGVVMEQIWWQYKYGFSRLKNPPVQFFGAIRATSGVWQHIAIFAWWRVHVILRGSTYYNIYNRRSFRQQFPLPKSRNQS